MKFDRSSGILLHPTSLPGRFGIGDFGDEAYSFVDFLVAGGQTLWQVMPLGPTGYGDSPYSSFSAFAGNTNLISPVRLVDDALLSDEDLAGFPALSDDRVEYGEVIERKGALLEKAYENFKRSGNNNHREQLKGFHHYAGSWLDDYALFSALADSNQGAAWNTWEANLARRDPDALRKASRSLSDRVDAHRFFQYLFFKQWLELKLYCKEKGVRVIGDMPIFVAHNSADVWANPGLFKLADDGSPLVVSGVPPDHFSKTGQLWGNPLYDWDQMRADNFNWWVERMRAALRLVDIVRIDHFRGFAACWEVPAGDETAENGRWVDVPGRELFHALKKRLGEMPVIAEDLGTITPDVHALREELGFPGMRVLQFAFGGDPRDTHLPHNYDRNTVVYTGTHDNDTVVGWFNAEPGEGSTQDAAQVERERELCLKYLNADGEEINWDFIRAALASVADVSIIQLQDVLGLGAGARMNVPASEQGNWGWRFRPGALTEGLGARLNDMTRLYGRAPE
ncbi:MAG: 4-alpha-glucanotransferase [Blastocatellia bacterium]